MFNPSVALELNGPRTKGSLKKMNKTPGAPPWQGGQKKKSSGLPLNPRIMSQTVQTRKTILALRHQEKDKQASVEGGLKKSFLPFSFISLRNVLSRPQQPQSCTKKTSDRVWGFFFNASKSDSLRLAPITAIKTMLLQNLSL